MFTRTARLLLRPGWAEDAGALAGAIADELIVRNLATAPWPYSLRDAEAFLNRPREAALPSLLVFARTDGDPLLVGGCGLGASPSGAVELGYWIARPFWGRNYASEAATSVIDIARTLRVPRLVASYFLDNPASGRILEKLGFEPTGVIAPRLSCGRGTEALASMLTLELGAGAAAEESMAA
jgi:RimJ/RimL family protein N-acetyltransferase